MTARQAANGALGLEKYYLCERSIKEEVRGDWGPQLFYICSHAVLQSQGRAIKRFFLFFSSPQNKMFVGTALMTT